MSVDSDVPLPARRALQTLGRNLTLARRKQRNFRRRHGRKTFRQPRNSLTVGAW